MRVCFSTDAPPFLNISLAEAVSACVAISLAFVGSLYVWQATSWCCKLVQPSTAVSEAPQTDSGWRWHRDNPRHIVERFVSVLAMCVIVPLVLWASTNGNRMPGTTLWLTLGVRGEDAAAGTFLPLCLTMVLFLGPITHRAVDAMDSDVPEPRLVTPAPRAAEVLWFGQPRLHVIRALLMAPLAEEWIFRACIVPLLLSGGLDYITIVFTAPLFFGLAHFHHVVAMSKVVGWGTAIRGGLFQVLFTSLFGAYATYLFLQTGQWLGPLVTHAFCNAMGVPNLPAVRVHPKRGLIAFAYVCGLAGFICLLATEALLRPSLLGSPYCSGF